ncbi:MAG: MarR family transcriptional regulator [Candidatus Cloacimonetes bacterium]|nr:MarR family transcriptional regulator [Candidatus Cloacimonadota bacterium]
MVITGTIPIICFAKGMTSYLYQKGIRIFDYPRFAETFKLKIRENTENIAKANGIEIEFIRKKNVRKEDLIQKILDKRGNAPGLVHIISAMETCPTYKPWHNKMTGKTYLKHDTSKCLHYYFYFIDEVLGLCYVRVPTWCPFRLQIYFNGHNWLASELDKNGIRYSKIDNAFEHINDFDKAQHICDNLKVKVLHNLLDKFAETYCPVFKDFNQVYHWSVMQAEYATDIVFKLQSDLKTIYDSLINTAIHPVGCITYGIHTVKPDNIATFLGKKLHGNYTGDMGNNYNVRIEGSRIKHNMGKVSIKMYDKFGKILRIETTTNNISFFKHYRKVEHKDGTISKKHAAMKKNIYSLDPLKDILKASNRRYLQFISAIEDYKVGKTKLEKISKTITKGNRHYKGFNFFNEEDHNLLMIIMRGEFNISGFQNKNIRKFLVCKTSSQLSRILKRLMAHGLIKRIRNTYKYYLTQLGKQMILIGLKIKNLVIIPELNYMKTV